MMNAVIWFLVMDDAQMPIAIIWAARERGAHVLGHHDPGVGFRHQQNPERHGQGPGQVIITKSQLPRALPSTISDSVSGCAISHSSVRPRRSSARLFIATAGMNTTRSQGRRSKNGRSDAVDMA